MNNLMSYRVFRTLRLLKKDLGVLSHRSITTTTYPQLSKFQPKELPNDSSLHHLDDPDTFGTLSGIVTKRSNVKDLDDEKEEEFLENKPMPSQKLTTKQYADIIKDYLKNKRLKEALDVLEVRMSKEDRVKPENYIYNILIGGCADVGYTKKAFKLYNDMKRRDLKITGDTYTCLFNACANSPWLADGLKRAEHLRQIMIEKRIEPNVTNYNVMIKAFGRCGDLSTAFQLVDEMINKKIKIRVHTLNFLLQSCITDKGNGLRHALLVWRKMLKLREKPNIYSFNLMLKCVKDCNFGSQEELNELMRVLKENSNNEQKLIGFESTQLIQEPTANMRLLNDTSLKSELSLNCETQTEVLNTQSIGIKDELKSTAHTNKLPTISVTFESDTENTLQISQDPLQILQEPLQISQDPAKIRVPNLLSKVPEMSEVLSFQTVQTLTDKFAFIGGKDGFLNEMKLYSVKPDIKTFTQMLQLIPDTLEAENELLKTIKLFDIKPDMSFYNMLMKKRCMRLDYENAKEVKNLIQEESAYRSRKFPLKKNLLLKPDLLTYGIQAMTCQTKEDAEVLLNEMGESKLKINIEILGTLLRQGTSHCSFGYVLYIMNMARDEKLIINDVFFDHLKNFKDKCQKLMARDENGTRKCSKQFSRTYGIYIEAYERWLQEVEEQNSNQAQHPWQQFTARQPETFQRQNIISETKKFLKPKRKFVKPYRPSI